MRQFVILDEMYIGQSVIACTDVVGKGVGGGGAKKTGGKGTGGAAAVAGPGVASESDISLEVN